MVGASPDRLIDDDEGLEIKVPYAAKQHRKYQAEGPGEAIWQCLGGALCTKRKAWTFVSYDPRERPELQLYVHRIDRDPLMLRSLGGRLTSFCTEHLAPMLQFVGIETGDLPQSTKPCFPPDDGKAPNLF